MFYLNALREDFYSIGKSLSHRVECLIMMREIADQIFFLFTD